MKQLYSEIPKLKTYIVITRANQKKINVKNNFKTNEIKLFLQKNLKQVIKISVLSC